MSVDDSLSSGSEICNPSGKRIDYLDWNEYFMGIAFLSGLRSKDPKTCVGACIVDRNNIIVGVGYNGLPRGCNDDKFPWTKASDNLKNKHFYVCHAEVNAILNKNVNNLEDCKMFVSLFPCNECAKVIIQSGIRNIIYVSDKNSKQESTIAAKKMFDAAGVYYNQYIPQKKIVIDFSKIDETVPRLSNSESVDT